MPAKKFLGIHAAAKIQHAHPDLAGGYQGNEPMLAMTAGMGVL
jgi:hypothetical protein